MIVPAGKTNVTVYFKAVEDASGTTPGAPKTGMTNTNITSASYVRTRGLRVAISTADGPAVDDPHDDGDFIEVDATNLPGVYRFDIPDAAVAVGANEVIIQIVFTGGSNAEAAPLAIDLAVADAVWDALRSNHLTDLTFGKSVGGLVEAEGVVGASPAPNSSVFDTDITNSNNSFHLGSIAHFIDGALAGQSRPILKLTGASGLMTVSPAFPVAPTAGDKLVVLPAFAPEGIADAVWDQVFTELASVPSLSPNARSAMTMIYMAFRNKIITDSGAGDTKIHNDAGTAIGTATVTDAAGVFTRDKYS